MGKKILIVGQTPPPFGGQAIMIEKIVSWKYNNLKVYHVRMEFSKEMDEIGKFMFSKISHLLVLIFKILFFRLRHNIDTLYYPPTGPNKIPFYRDVVILSIVRPFFKKTCFHFHAGGVSELYPSLSPIMKLLYKTSYYDVDLGIRLSESSPDDPKAIKAKQSCIIPYGIKDCYTDRQPKIIGEPCVILFVGLLSESKGLTTLIDVISKLKIKKLNFSVLAVGKFESADYEKEIKDKIEVLELDSYISFLGVLTGEKKYEAYQKSDVFCFPSFFEAESFPVVLLEASSFSLPIVSTKWRGIPSIVKDGESGFLLPIKDVEAISEKIELLIVDDRLRKQMGENARIIYLNNWTEEKFYQNISTALSSI